MLIINWDYAIRNRELNLLVCSYHIKIPADVVNMLKENKQVKQTAIESQALDGRQVVDDPCGVPYSALVMLLEISDLAVCVA